jgi:hypothetical protein
VRIPSVPGTTVKGSSGSIPGLRRDRKNEAREITAQLKNHSHGLIEAHFVDAAIAELRSGALSAVRRCGSPFQRPAALETGRDLARTAAFGQNHADPVASAWDPVAAAASRP